VMRSVALLASLLGAQAQQVDWVQTVRHDDGTVKLLEPMPPLTMQPLSKVKRALVIDRRTKFQEIVGFGGAFTEASALNWKRLSAEDQAEVIRLYFASPEEGGHGYTLGRVPINSCDFSPASYTFDDVKDDMELEHFDTTVQHDVTSGMIPMIQAAQDAITKRGAKLTLFASPWTMPAWMKEPVDGKQSLTASASPNGLMPSMMRPWAKYFSKFISAYRAHGIDMWGVTVQNEPEAAVGWEACLWTPEYQAQFVKDHLGPVLQEEQPGVKIIGFDHNKDHVHVWAKGLYADPEAKKWFAGIGIHWYGGLNVHNLNATHNLAPDKFILGTEACNCGGVVLRTPDSAAWWSRAESLALDILEDLRFWAVGWTDWNLVLSTAGGPNHLQNLCDANIIVDPKETRGLGKLIMQASYYYMGHFSRFIPAGSRRVALKNTVEIKEDQVSADDVKNGQALLFSACDVSEIQSWTLDDTHSLIMRGTDEAEGSDGFQHGGECVDIDSASMTKIQVWACAHSANQQWSVKSVPGGHQVINTPSGKCLTAVPTSGLSVGLDAGVTVTAAQLKPCAEDGDKTQTFALANYDQGGFPDNFHVRLPGEELCLQPQIQRLPHFDAVAFEQPSGKISLVAMNMGEKPISFSIVDAESSTGVHDVTLAPHAIHSYTWMPTAAAAAETAATVNAPTDSMLPAAAPQPTGSFRAVAWCSVTAAAAAVVVALYVKQRRAAQGHEQGSFEPATDSSYVEFQEVDDHEVGVHGTKM